jgi:hypothetical protein
MGIREVVVIVDRQERTVTPGLKQGSDLINAFGLSEKEQLLLEIHGDIDVLVGEGDLLLVTGGEVFSIGDGDPEIEDNPRLRHPIRCMLNEQSLTEQQALKHPKISAAELKKLDPEAENGSRLIADLDGLADEVIEDHQRIIVKPQDQFIVMPPPDEHSPDHDIHVTIDGRGVTLPAGDYLVAVLKQKLAVPADYELEQVKHGQFHPLADESTFQLRKHEEFISHVRTGSSS